MRYVCVVQFTDGRIWDSTGNSGRFDPVVEMVASHLMRRDNLKLIKNVHIFIGKDHMQWDGDGFQTVIREMAV